MALRKWRNFFALSPEERSLFLRAYALTWAVRLQLWLLPFEYTRRIATACAKRAHQQSLSDDVGGICGAVVRAARYVPAATCLTQALAAWILLSRRGIPSSIRFGVVPNGRGQIAAHAWVEAAPARPGEPPRVLIGGETSPRRFVALERAGEDRPANASCQPRVPGRPAPALHM